MRDIITTAEVLSLAFGDGAYIAPELITPTDIETATHRWVTPVVGQSLIDAVKDGRYATFAEEYLKPTVALFVRYTVQPRLNASTSQMGLGVQVSSSRKAADEAARRELMQSLLAEARAALKRMSQYLEENSQQMAEYNPSKNILKRCSIDGGFVQIH